MTWLCAIVVMFGCFGCGSDSSSSLGSSTPQLSYDFTDDQRIGSLEFSLSGELYDSGYNGGLADNEYKEYVGWRISQIDHLRVTVSSQYYSSGKYYQKYFYPEYGPIRIKLSGIEAGSYELRSTFEDNNSYCVINLPTEAVSIFDGGTNDLGKPLLGYFYPIQPVEMIFTLPHGFEDRLYSITAMHYYGGTGAYYQSEGGVIRGRMLMPVIKGQLYSLTVTSYDNNYEVLKSFTAQNVDFSIMESMKGTIAIDLNDYAGQQ